MALEIKKNEVDSTTVSQFTYAVNDLGQRTGVTTTGSAFGNTDRGWTWGYDSLGQAVKALNAADSDFDRAYVFDSIGNRITATDGSGGGATTTGYTPNKLNQYTAIDPGTEVNPVHDPDGNLLEDAGVNAMAYGLKYEWDAENRIGEWTFTLFQREASGQIHLVEMDAATMAANLNTLCMKPPDNTVVL